MMIYKNYVNYGPLVYWGIRCPGVFVEDPTGPSPPINHMDRHHATWTIQFQNWRRCFAFLLRVHFKHTSLLAIQKCVRLPNSVADHSSITIDVMRHIS
jgi:hypothetical protein